MCDLSDARLVASKTGCCWYYYYYYDYYYYYCNAPAAWTKKFHSVLLTWHCYW